MTLIDQRILIPAPMNAVWAVVADHQQLPRWRAGCRAVSVLSTHDSGVGVRRRITPHKGKDFIEEFKAWYAGYGYEYQVVDSKTYQEHLTRLRLQATPDGTIVQWTIDFKLRGWLARLLFKRRRRHALNQDVTQSLRELRRFVMSHNPVIDDAYRTRTGIQHAPDADQRAKYGATRLADQASVAPSIERDDPTPSSGVTITEPPVQPEDTPSIPKEPPPAFITQQFDVAVEAVPDESDKDTSEDSLSDTQPNQPLDPATLMKTRPPQAEEDDEAETGAEATQETTVGSEEVTEEAEAPRQAEAAASATNSPTTEISTSTQPPLSTHVVPAEENAVSRTATKPRRPTGLDETQSPADQPSPAAETKTTATPGNSTTPHRETDSMTIWEVFGIERPSDISDPQSVTSAPEIPKLPPRELPSATEQAAASLDAWLAREEPPLPASASTTVKTIVRASTKPPGRMGLRKHYLRRQANVRALKTVKKL